MMSNSGRNNNQREAALFRDQECNFGIKPASGPLDSPLQNPITPPATEFPSPTTTCTNTNAQPSAKDTVVGRNEPSTMKRGARRKARQRARKSREANKDEMDNLPKQSWIQHDQENQEEHHVVDACKGLHKEVVGNVEIDSASACCDKGDDDDEWYTCLMEKYKDGPYLYAERAYGIKINPDACRSDQDLFRFKDEWYTSLMKRYRDDTAHPWATRTKRPLYIIDQYPGHMESSIIRPQFNFTDAIQVTHCRDTYEANDSTSLYSRNCYDVVDYNDRHYPFFEGGNRYFGGGY